MTTETLHILQSGETLDLKSSVEAAFTTSNTTALLYGARTTCIASGSAGKFVCGTNVVDLAEIYQADVFTDDATLIWRRTAGPKGTANLLSVSPQPPMTNWLNTEPMGEVFHVDQRHLIWGQAITGQREEAEGWTRLSAARIGALSVPVHVPTGHKAVLNAKAWFRPLPEACGNPQFIGRTWGALTVIPMTVKGGERL